MLWYGSAGLALLLGALEAQVDHVVVLDSAFEANLARATVVPDVIVLLTTKLLFQVVDSGIQFSVVISEAHVFVLQRANQLLEGLDAVMFVLVSAEELILTFITEELLHGTDALVLAHLFALELPVAVLARDHLFAAGGFVNQVLESLESRRTEVALHDHLRADLAEVSIHISTLHNLIALLALLESRWALLNVLLSVLQAEKWDLASERAHH